MWIPIAAGVLVAGGVALFVARWREHQSLLAESHFRHFHELLVRAIERAEGKPRDKAPSLGDHTAFMTDAGLAVAVTRGANEDGRWSLHISMSQPGKSRTSAVLCSRIGFFVIRMLHRNRAELYPHYTRSGVHHLAFSLPSEELVIEQFEAAWGSYCTSYQPVPFVYQDLSTGAESGR